MAHSSGILFRLGLGMHCSRWDAMTLRIALACLGLVVDRDWRGSAAA